MRNSLVEIDFNMTHSLGIRAIYILARTIDCFLLSIHSDLIRHCTCTLRSSHCLRIDGVSNMFIWKISIGYHLILHGFTSISGSLLSPFSFLSFSVLMSVTPAQIAIVKSTVPILEQGGVTLTTHFYKLMLNVRSA